MSKVSYLMEQFERMQGKDFENYVINAIYQRVGNPNLIPETQTYAKRNNGKYALLDLYFPQINVWVEVDEPRHELCKDEDKIREMEVRKNNVNIIKALDEKTVDINNLTAYDILASANQYDIENAKLERISYTDDIDELNKEIDDVVIVIKNKIKDLKQPLKWENYKDKLNEIKEKNKLTRNDEIYFYTNKQVLNDVFGANLKSYGRGHRTCKNYGIWFPNIYIEGMKPSLWKDVLSKNFNTILEELNEDKYVEGITMPRITFIRYRGYKNKLYIKFLGVYEFVGRDKNKREFRCISQEINLKECAKNY